MTARASQDPTALPLDKETLLTVYRKMRTIRDFEERLHVDFARGSRRGWG